MKIIIILLLPKVLGFINTIGLLYFKSKLMTALGYDLMVLVLSYFLLIFANFHGYLPLKRKHKKCKKHEVLKAHS